MTINKNWPNYNIIKLEREYQRGNNCEDHNKFILGQAESRMSDSFI